MDFIPKIMEFQTVNVLLNWGIQFPNLTPKKKNSKHSLIYKHINIDLRDIFNHIFT